MLRRINVIMRKFKESGNYPMLYVVDRVANRSDAVVLIVDIFYEDRGQAEEFVKAILELLSSHNIKVLKYGLDSYYVPWREVWRFVAVVAVDNSQ
jgi:NADPH-dependent 2,4-dienoyl-CoA reductase/sulfur reductase-like enzyme